MPMMNMMSGMMSNMPMMNMMEMMRTMRMMGPGTTGMATIDRIEGRIAFLRTELKITEAQTSAWNAFANALRANAKKLGEVRASMMPPSAAGQQQAPTLIERLDAQERWMLARLEGTRTMKSALSTLYESLSDDQKKSANELLAPHMGMGMGMMATMPAQMQPSQMQPGQMQPGQMQPEPEELAEPIGLGLTSGDHFKSVAAGFWSIEVDRTTWKLSDDQSGLCNRCFRRRCRQGGISSSDDASAHRAAHRRNDLHTLPAGDREGPQGRYRRYLGAGQSSDQDGED